MKPILSISIAIAAIVALHSPAKQKSSPTFVFLLPMSGVPQCWQNAFNAAKPWHHPKNEIA